MKDIEKLPELNELEQLEERKAQLEAALADGTINSDQVKAVYAKGVTSVQERIAKIADDSDLIDRVASVGMGALAGMQQLEFEPLAGILPEEELKKTKDDLQKAADRASTFFNMYGTKNDASKEFIAVRNQALGATAVNRPVAQSTALQPEAGSKASAEAPSHTYEFELILNDQQALLGPLARPQNLPPARQNTDAPYRPARAVIAYFAENPEASITIDDLVDALFDEKETKVNSQDLTYVMHELTLMKYRTSRLIRHEDDESGVRRYSMNPVLRPQVIDKSMPHVPVTTPKAIAAKAADTVVTALVRTPLPKRAEGEETPPPSIVRRMTGPGVISSPFRRPSESSEGDYSEEAQARLQELLRQSLTRENASAQEDEPQKAESAVVSAGPEPQSPPEVTTAIDEFTGLEPAAHINETIDVLEANDLVADADEQPEAEAEIVIPDESESERERKQKAAELLDLKVNTLLVASVLKQRVDVLKAYRKGVLPTELVGELEVHLSGFEDAKVPLKKRSADAACQAIAQIINDDDKFLAACDMLEMNSPAVDLLDYIYNNFESSEDLQLLYRLMHAEVVSKREFGHALPSHIKLIIVDDVNKPIVPILRDGKWHAIVPQPAASVSPKKQVSAKPAAKKLIPTKSKASKAAAASISAKSARAKSAEAPKLSPSQVVAEEARRLSREYAAAFKDLDKPQDSPLIRAAFPTFSGSLVKYTKESVTDQSNDRHALTIEDFLRVRLMTDPKTRNFATVRKNKKYMDSLIKGVAGDRIKESIEKNRS